MTPDDELQPESLRVVDLKKELQARKLSTKGRKLDLIKRLNKYLEEAKAGTDDPVDKNGPAEEEENEGPKEIDESKAVDAKKTEAKQDSEPPATEKEPEEDEAAPPPPSAKSTSILDILDGDDDDDMDEEEVAPATTAPEEVAKEAVEAKETKTVSGEPSEKLSEKPGEKPGEKPNEEPVSKKEAHTREEPRAAKRPPKKSRFRMFAKAVNEMKVDNEAAINSGKRAPHESVRGSKRPRDSEGERDKRGEKRIKRVARVARAATKASSPRKGRFEDLTFSQLERRIGRYIKIEEEEGDRYENITVEIHNDEKDSQASSRSAVKSSPAPLKAKPIPEGERSNALRIDGFVRPFRVSQVRELLDKHGQVSHMWMDKIKTHCYVMYPTKAQAESCLKALHNLQWPEDSIKMLTVKYVSEDEAVEAARPKAIKEVRTEEEKPKTQLKTLDELFRRTKAKPSLYWLPRDKPKERVDPVEGREKYRP